LSNAIVRWNLVMAIVAGMVFNLSVVPPLVATNVFHRGGSGFALTVTLSGVGALVGAVLAMVNKGGLTFRGVRALAFATGAAVLATGLAWRFELWLAGMMLTGALSILYFSRSNALVQLGAPRSMRGRLMSLWTMARYGSVAVTAPLAGLMADALGPRLAWMGPGAIFVCAALITGERRRGS
jgi:hypothetical protein